MMTKVEAATRWFMSGCVSVAIASAIACTDLMAPLPSGAVEWNPPARFALWWRMTESCSGRLGDFRAIRWYIMPNTSSFDLDGTQVSGAAIGKKRIVLADAHRLDGSVVRHEMLHTLLDESGHPRGAFMVACDGVVSCGSICEAEGGGRAAPPSDAPVLEPRDVAPRVEIVPRLPAASQDGGAVAVTVSITNPLGTAVWVRLAPQAPGDPLSHTFGVILDYGDPDRFGIQDYTYVEGTRFPLAAHETRRFVWDGVLAAGDYGLRGWFNSDTLPRSVLSVGP